MAQQSWTYADDGGQLYNIGLYHGSPSGHVIVYCNSNIMVIDFSILDTKQYSFYVGEEFFELNLELQDSLFHYELKINDTVRSPLNKIRNNLQRRYNMISLGIGVLICGGIILAVILMTY